MNTRSPLKQPRHFPVSRLVALTLVGLALGGHALAYVHEHVGEFLQAVNAKKNTSRTPLHVAAPILNVETHASFQYEQWMEMINRVPTAPNTWHVESKITNNGSSPIEVFPMYLYSEAYPSKPEAWENSSTICPKSYSHAFSAAAQDGLTIAPEDLSGKVQQEVFLPMDQLSQPPDLSHGGTFAGMTTDRTFTAALSVDAKAVSWGKSRLDRSSTVDATWEFQSIWAARREIRSGPGFYAVQLGPVIRSASATRGTTYLVVVRFEYDPNENGTAMKQSSVQLQEITPALPQDLSKAFPNNRPSVEEFGNAALKIGTEP